MLRQHAPRDQLLEAAARANFRLFQASKSFESSVQRGPCGERRRFEATLACSGLAKALSLRCEQAQRGCRDRDARRGAADGCERCGSPHKRPSHPGDSAAWQRVSDPEAALSAQAHLDASAFMQPKLVQASRPEEHRECNLSRPHAAQRADRRDLRACSWIALRAAGHAHSGCVVQRSVILLRSLGCA